MLYFEKIVYFCSVKVKLTITNNNEKDIQTTNNSPADDIGVSRVYG